jgi:molecular chaperone GrpE
MKKTSPKKTTKSVDLENQLKRALADYQNLKKRIDQHQQDFVKYSNAALLDKLLPILDDLERAQAHLKDKGLALIAEQFVNLLESEGVTEIKVLNTEFDPATADCVELTKGPKNQILSVTQKGYTLNGKVLRPAQVKVGKGG